MKELNEFPVLLEMPVQWGEMDAAQHVNNLVYLRWFESARVEYVSRLGADVVAGGHEAGFILAKQDCKYLFPLTFPDTVTIGIRVVDVEKDRFRMECKIFSQRRRRLVAIANGVMVAFDYEKQQKMPISNTLLANIRQLENNEL